MSDGDVSVWRVELSDGDIYWVFARNEDEALQVVIDTHYDSMSFYDFRDEFAPQVGPLDGRRVITVHHEGGQQSKTAYEWARGELVGPFCSNTYEL